MNPALTLIAASIAAALGFTSAWQMQAHTITKIHLEQADERIAIQRAARTQAERHIAAVTVAQNNATVRAGVLRANVRSAALIGDGLRVKTFDAVRSAATDPALCSDTSAALGELLTSVSAERRELAETADRHVIDIQALMERAAGAD